MTSIKLQGEDWRCGLGGEGFQGLALWRRCIRDVEEHVGGPSTPLQADGTGFLCSRGGGMWCGDVICVCTRV